MYLQTGKPTIQTYKSKYQKMTEKPKIIVICFFLNEIYTVKMLSFFLLNYKRNVS